MEVQAVVVALLVLQAGLEVLETHHLPRQAKVITVAQTERKHLHIRLVVVAEQAQ
jgi:hypothetical protein